MRSLGGARREDGGGRREEGGGIRVISDLGSGSEVWWSDSAIQRYSQTKVCVKKRKTRIEETGSRKMFSSSFSSFSRFSRISHVGGHKGKRYHCRTSARYRQKGQLCLLHIRG